MGVPGVLSLISNLYTNNHSFVRFDTDCSNVFETKKGVRQGCILSPLLFNIYGEYIIRTAQENWERGFAFGGTRITDLRYADDTVLLATPMDDMRVLLQKLGVESEELGLTINRCKAKLMIVDGACKLSDANTIGIDIVEKFIYLTS